MPIQLTPCFSTTKQIAPYVLLNLKDTISHWNPPEVFLQFIYPTSISNILYNFPFLWQSIHNKMFMQIFNMSQFLSFLMVRYTGTGESWTDNLNLHLALTRRGVAIWA